MKILITLFSVPKSGNSEEENEDHFHPANDCFKGDEYTVAIADGASEGMFSSVWSKILVELYVSDYNLIKTPKSYFLEAKKRFDKWKSEYIASREEAKFPLYWFEELGFSKGAFSTLLGVSFHDRDLAIWESHAIGDSCIFQIRDDKVYETFPLGHSSTFNNQPMLFSNKSEYNIEVFSQTAYKYGEWLSGDNFFLMTDALAHWFLLEYESNNKPWHSIMDFQNRNEDVFQDWIDCLRSNKKIRNDDTTLAMIRIL